MVLVIAESFRIFHDWISKNKLDVTEFVYVSYESQVMNHPKDTKYITVGKFKVRRDCQNIVSICKARKFKRVKLKDL